MIFKHDTITSVKRFNSLKLGNTLYIRKIVSIREYENRVLLLKQKKIEKNKTKFFPIAELTDAYLLVYAYKMLCFSS
jgi:hypothetical protein